MTEPTTPTGKRRAAYLLSVGDRSRAASIATIEQEAAAAERERLRAWAEQEHAINCDTDEPFIRCKKSMACFGRQTMLVLPWDSDLVDPEASTDE